MKKYILFLFLLLINTSFLLAQTGKISGKITDSQTGEPLFGANVMIQGTSMGAATTINGNYVIYSVPAGTYKLHATYIGYKSEVLTVKIKTGEALKQDFKLKPVSLTAKEVVITAQASGQNSAINQQLTSDKIVNVVSADKIQSLPDANAAASVGRLPGVSIIRQGGEASEVVIRGLAPQYNQILIDGVQMPATNSDDRGTDLSMISSSMLNSISVTKAITPDMDAAVLGGVVNFSLREAQTTNGMLKANITAQGGYDKLQTTYGPYKFVGSVEDRFFNDKFGVFAEVTAENVNLSSNVFGASYFLGSYNVNLANPTYLSSMNLNDVYSTRKRYGATVTLDYKIPDGKIDFMNFVSTSNTGSTNRGASYSILSDVYSNSTTSSKNDLNVITNLLDIQKTLSIFNIDLKLAHSYSESHDPNDLSVSFRQDNVPGLGAQGTVNPQDVPSKGTIDNSKNNLYYITNNSSFTGDRTFNGSIDFLSHLNFSDLITSSLKFGGMYKYTIRSHDYNQSNGVLDQASGTNVRAAIISAYPWMTKPPYNLNPNGTDLIPLTAFADPNFSYGKFLGGTYSMGVPANEGMLWNLLSIVQNSGTLDAYSHNDWASKTYDYSGNEYESAGYVMYTLNVGPILTFIPGVRYQSLTTSYTAPRGIETSTASLAYHPIDTTVDETHGYWLPMAQLIYKPLDWLQLHLAYTNTLSYPDYRAIIPWLDIGTGSPKPVTWNNVALKPGRSANYDAAISLYSNEIGLFTVDGFLKQINDLIFSASRYIINPSQYPGIPQGNTLLGDPIYTYINNPYTITVKGVELDWQTHFWYLPGAFSGLVLSVNYTHIFSAAKYPLSSLKLIYNPNPRIPPVKTEIDTFYTDRLIDQPNDIANLALGYDYQGFSVRISMIYKSNVFTGENYWQELRANTSNYVRWDLSAKQDLPWYNLQVYFDINNLNDENDISINQGSNFPTSQEDYGLTADIGLRWHL